MEKEFDLDEYAKERDAYIADIEKYSNHLNKFRKQKQESLNNLSVEEETNYLEDRANKNLNIAKDVFNKIDIASQKDNGGKK